MIELDVHAHLAPVNPGRLAPLEGVQWLAAEKTLVVDGARLAVKALFEPQRLLSWLDTHSIARALVSIPPPLYRQHLPIHTAAVWVRYLNTELAQLCEHNGGGRLEPLFFLPMEHPALLGELLEKGEAERYGGLVLAAGGHASIDYSQEHYAALWQWANRHSSFVFIHPGTCADCRLRKFYLENLVGNPLETGIAATHLVMAGVPARFPDIRFCLAHAGGIFPAIVGRVQRGFDTSRPGIDMSVEPPLQAARRFYADGIAHHPTLVQLAQDVFGAEHVLFGSDWPFPMGLDASRG
jgi:aminocarboxymuconate-semialdehyde decarboxylase